MSVDFGSKQAALLRLEQYLLVVTEDLQFAWYELSREESNVAFSRERSIFLLQVY